MVYIYIYVCVCVRVLKEGSGDYILHIVCIYIYMLYMHIVPADVMEVVGHTFSKKICVMCKVKTVIVFKKNMHNSSGKCIGKILHDIT
jgi:hypothetical protein